MRGYNLPKKPIEYKEDNVLVGCRRCNNTWTEKRVCGPWRINGAVLDYDYCDKCITDKEKGPIEFGKVNGFKARPT